MDVIMECFASPFNCRWERYCSAFPDTDTAFGSLGSFFEFRPAAGSFEVNPPFVPEVIVRTAAHIEALLAAAKASPLSFVVVVPAWEATPGWRRLAGSRFVRRHVRLAQKDHGFCEGKQQLRAARYRVASFDTSVLVLQNAAGAARWPCTDKACAELRTAFASLQATE
ncbi:unnamed protein product, partial [Phaeothamnion confervicola]